MFGLKEGSGRHSNKSNSCAESYKTFCVVIYTDVIS